MSTPTKQVAFKSLGCKLNFSETSTIARDCVSIGFECVDFDQKADFYVINTCSVTENANRDARKLIRKAKLKNPESNVVIIGCYAQLNPEELSKIDGVDVVLGAKEKFNILDYLNEKELKKSPITAYSQIEHVNDFKPSYSLDERTRSYLKVQDGCDYNCSFCTIPLARGKSRSAEITKVIDSAKKIRDYGKKEIVLTGVNIGDFGAGADYSLIDLINELEKVDSLERIRISSIEPNLLTDEILEACSLSSKFVPHFHIPLQSGSDKVLRDMRRRYTSKFYESLVHKIKSINNETCIGVDVIVGYPKESDCDFLETYKFIENLDISYLHVFTFSERANTRAIKLKNKVSINTKKDRSKILRKLSTQKQNLFYSKFLNKKKKVLFESKRNGLFFGHTDNYIKVSVDSEKPLLNKIMDVRLVDNIGDSILGTF